MCILLDAGFKDGLISTDRPTDAYEALRIRPCHIVHRIQRVMILPEYHLVLVKNALRGLCSELSKRGVITGKSLKINLTCLSYCATIVSTTPASCHVCQAWHEYAPYSTSVTGASGLPSMGSCCRRSSVTGGALALPLPKLITSRMRPSTATPPISRNGTALADFLQIPLDGCISVSDSLNDLTFFSPVAEINLKF